MTPKPTPGQSRGNRVADAIAGLTTGVKNVFVATTTLRESMRAGYAGAELWLQTPPAEADQTTR